MLKIILSVIFILICVALTVVVLLQEGKSAGLGAISGMADTYWGKKQGTFHGRQSAEVYYLCSSCIYGTGNCFEFTVRMEEALLDTARVLLSFYRKVRPEQ